MIYGYARVSTHGQCKDGNGLEDQIKQLQKCGCDEIITEAYTGKVMERPELQNLLKKIKQGDTIIVTKLDRFARTVIDGVQTIKDLYDKGVKVNVLNMGVVENNLTGNLVLTIMLAFAEFERGMIVERTQAGKAIAKQNPDYREGRPPKYKKLQINHALDLLNSGMSYSQVANLTGISKSTLIRAKKKKVNTQ